MIDGILVVNLIICIIFLENINLVYFGIKYIELYVSLKVIFYRKKMNIILVNFFWWDVNNMINIYVWCNCIMILKWKGVFWDKIKMESFWYFKYYKLF